MNDKSAEFNKFFYPESILVIGVSPAPSNLGRNIVSNLPLAGYNGEILSAGRTPGVVFGQRIYLSIEEINRPVDLAVVLTPAATVPGILEQGSPWLQGCGNINAADGRGVHRNDRGR
ncbi:MAG TPA: hypothetical protein ENN79_09690 [Desulfobacteraceae bacterium]|nr:hypothetical protein [Desulfobacteraceae bacterium]